MSKQNDVASQTARQPAFSGDEEVLSPKEAAGLTGLTISTLRDYRSKRDIGRGPKFQKDGRTVTYRLSDLLSWIDGRRGDD